MLTYIDTTERQIARYLDALAGEQPMARALFLVNHYARRLRRCELRDTIYDLKTRLLRYWCQAGYCVDVTMHEQVLTCWECGGSGWTYWGDDQEPCDHCNDGVYAVHRLYFFTFDFGGQRYGWHQPERFVDWPVTVNDAATRNWNERDESAAELPTWQDLHRYIALLAAYAEKVGA